MRTLLAVAVLALSALAIPSAAEAHRFPVRNCGDLQRTTVVYNVTTRGLSCREARATARFYRRQRVGPNMYERVRRIGPSQYDVRLTRFSYVVRFQMVMD